MRNKFYLFIFSLFCIPILAQNIGITVYRSEYEKINDIIYDINDSQENISSYSITAGNNYNYYSINASTGQIKIANPIVDAFDAIHTDNLTISIGYSTYQIQIVDAFDYYKNELLANGYELLANDNETYIDNASLWTAYNNTWGKGNAVINQDFRIAILKKNNTFPNGSIVLWDVPSEASVYNGAAVWAYVNLFWGNRKGIRENLPNFPFKIANINSLNLNFDFEKLFGSNDYKVALNLFTTDNPALANFSENKGDFFFVFDQINTYIPSYPFSLPDITIGGKPFAVRYDNMQNGQFYERRRVIVKNGEAFVKGNLDIKPLFDMFNNSGYLNYNQSIPNIQVGLEITNGFGAVRFNQLDFQLTKTLSTESFTKQQEYIYPNPTKDILNFFGQNIKHIKVYSVNGEDVTTVVRYVYHDANLLKIDVSGLISGMYIIKSAQGDIKFIKK